jgi:fibro-slime domain-containing protein
MFAVRDSKVRALCPSNRASLRAACAAVALASIQLFGCSSDDSDDGASSGGSSAAGGTGGLNIGTGGSGNSSSGGSGNQGPYVLPAGFTETEFGGYKLGDPFNGDAPPPSTGTGGSSGSSGGCGTTILAVVRDFKGSNESGGHGDFESFDGDGPTTGMVPNALGADSKPGYTGICEAANAGNSMLCPHGQQSTSQTNFAQWYNFAADVNRPYVIHLSLEPNGDKLTFQSDLFFPLDDAGWGNSGNGQDDQRHNFHFTTEVHTEFKYNGGEEFTFIGDDDVWVFINKKLVGDVDLGGLHPTVTGTLRLDERAGDLGITRGNTYPLDLFHAERHTRASNFRVDTNLQFTNCGTIVPEAPK